jgi:hypothetical protein
LDYEDPRQQNGFNVVVRVTDGRHDAKTKIFVKLRDVNDNPPRVEGPKERTLSEDVRVGTIVAKFTAKDDDFGGKDTHT